MSYEFPRGPPSTPVKFAATQAGTPTKKPEPPEHLAMTPTPNVSVQQVAAHNSTSSSGDRCTYNIANGHRARLLRYVSATKKAERKEDKKDEKKDVKKDDEEKKE